MGNIVFKRKIKYLKHYNFPLLSLCESFENERLTKKSLRMQDKMCKF